MQGRTLSKACLRSRAATYWFWVWATPRGTKAWTQSRCFLQPYWLSCKTEPYHWPMLGSLILGWIKILQKTERMTIGLKELTQRCPVTGFGLHRCVCRTQDQEDGNVGASSSFCKTVCRLCQILKGRAASPDPPHPSGDPAFARWARTALRS